MTIRRRSRRKIPTAGRNAGGRTTIPIRNREDGCRPQVSGTMKNDRLQTLREIGTGTAASKASETLVDMPARPALADIFKLRMDKPKFGMPFAAGSHCVECATLSLKAGMDDKNLLPCLLSARGML